MVANSNRISSKIRTSDYFNGKFIYKTFSQMQQGDQYRNHKACFCDETSSTIKRSVEKHLFTLFRQNFKTELALPPLLVTMLNGSDTVPEHLQ